MHTLFSDLNILKVQLILLVGGLVVLILEMFVKKHRNIAAGLSFLTLALAFINIPVKDMTAFNNMLIFDNFSMYFQMLFLILAFFCLFPSLSFLIQHDYKDSHLSLVLFATLGLILLSSANELILLYLALELVSVSFYVLVGCMREARGSEAAGKFILFGLFASCLLLYGLSILYGLTGTTNLSQMKIASIQENKLAILAMILVLLGFCFKAGIVPMHFWIADTYEGAPAPVVAFLSTASKAAGFLLLLRVFGDTFFELRQLWVPLFCILSFATMGVGNLIALWQTNLKRLLAYSSIAHAGYILIGVAMFSHFGFVSALIYLAIYSLANISAFSTVVAVGENIDDYAGLSRRAPLIAFALLISFISLIGIPPLAGFIAKFWVFSSAVTAGKLWLAISGVIYSVISIFYYFNVIKKMYIDEPTTEQLSIPSPIKIVLIVTSLLLILLGVYPHVLVDMSTLAAGIK